MRVTALTCVKNEGPFLIEWIAFHRVIGVTDFLIYSNHCTDGTDALLDKLAEHGVVTHLPNPAGSRDYRAEALKDAPSQPLVGASDWLWIADVDEFLNIRVGTGTLPELIAACGVEARAISITRQFFANCDVKDFDDRPVIAQFTRSHDPDLWGKSAAQDVKTLVRKDFPLDHYDANRPLFRTDMPKKDYPLWKDGSGREVPWKFRIAATKRRTRKFPAEGARDFATLNHYALRSLDSYLVKADRGDVSRDSRRFDAAYWRQRNDDRHEDRSILRYLPRLKAEIAALKALPGVAALHEFAVVGHREALERLMKDDACLTLREELLEAPRRAPEAQAVPRKIA
jgi:Glycosyl transferase family 2